MVRSTLTSLILAAACLFVAPSVRVVTVTATDPELGVKPTSVVTLTQGTFQLAIEDPANPLWLLKFYAPWCGHCKKLEPVLNSVASKVAGQMAIGKIDCTKEKKLCSEHAVRGYPTLKFSIDGELHDYPGGRAESEILAFAARLNLPPLQMLSSVSSVYDFAQTKTEEGVLFLAYHPQVVGESLEEKTQSTLLTQVYSQVARKGRAFGHYCILDPQADDLGTLKTLTKTSHDGSTTSVPPFVCRMEKGVEPRCYDDIDGVNMADLISFVREHNVATVSKLGPSNFGKVGRRGRPLVIVVVDGADNEEQVQATKEALTRYALSGPEVIREKYYYAWFDGKQWSKFLSQFNVYPQDSPQVFVLNVPDKKFWQNATYKLNIDEFLAAVEDGTIESALANRNGGAGDFFNTILAWIIENRPWSAAIIVLIIVAIGVLIATIVSPGQDLRPPYDMAPPPVPPTATKKTPAAAEPAPQSKKDD